MEITIQRCDYNHPDFHDLIRLLDQELDDRNGDVQKQYNAFNKIDQIGTVIIAYFDNKPAGCGCFKPYNEDSAEIKRMFVKKEARGNKIASLILSNLELWASELGFSKAILETGINQFEAIALYQKSGYQLIPNYGHYIGNPNSVCMIKQLESLT
jgi:GNAT superfamily N-acetyltransferase